MPSILNLKFKGNKSFVAFSNLNDSESLTKTWKVCTKVASYLEQGQRLENLSWRLWHLQNLMVDTDNAKSKREFKKLSKCMGDKLDKEKGRSIVELEAPDFKRNHSTDIIQQRAAEKERMREANQHTQPGTIKRMQFTFSVDQPSHSFTSGPVRKPDLKPSPEFTRRPKASDKDLPAASNTDSLHFPSLFSNDFGPAALLYPAPTLTNTMNYGEGHHPTGANDGFSIVRPTIELPLDDLLDERGTPLDDRNSPLQYPAYPLDEPDIVMNSSDLFTTHILPSPSTNQYPSPSPNLLYQQQENQHYTQQEHQLHHDNNISQLHHDNHSSSSSSSDSEDDGSEFGLPSTSNSSYSAQESSPKTAVPLKSATPLYRASTPTGRPTLTVRTGVKGHTGPKGYTATPTNLNPGSSRTPTANLGNSAPGGVKAECSNCGATHTPLWRRGLNDELNCNACGLYCKLHKRPRPKTMRNNTGDGRSQNVPRPETIDVMAQCYNCHTTTTPLWRKDDEGKTVCNACGLYYKLHGSARPISMKSDVIRKRSRHEARRSIADTPSASPGVSRRASPVREASPVFSPDSTTQISPTFDESFSSSTSELMGALGQDGHDFDFKYHFQFPGPYPGEQLTNLLPPASDAPHFGSMTSPRSNKRRRMSSDSSEDPPSSAVSYSSFAESSNGSFADSSYSSHSQTSSMDFPFSTYPLPSFMANSHGSSMSGAGAIFRGSGNAFWHPPLLPNGGLPSPQEMMQDILQGKTSPTSMHPPMLPDDSPMDYLHPPMMLSDQAMSTDQDHMGMSNEDLFAAFVHPPMNIPEERHEHQGYEERREHQGFQERSRYQKR
ncbi:hypothetical protein C8J56DRAFT_1014657 [Mycena floridula]|nr:hypothetical protein C8J56DRAFT_1014657 [Mycena floridula]